MHILSLKYLGIVKKDYFYSFLVGVIALAIVSRISIYYAMTYVSNPTIVQLFVNVSSIFILSLLLLKMESFSIVYFLLGISIGLFFIQYSYSFN